MADDLAGMAAQFTGGDVTPRAADTPLGSFLTNTLMPGATPGVGTGDLAPLSFGATGEGAGSGYLAASQKLAEVAAAAALADYVVEKGILATRIGQGDQGDGSFAGQMARLAVINTALGFAADDLGSTKK